MMRPKFLNCLYISRILGLLFISISLNGCIGTFTPCFYVDSVQFKVEADANNNSATEVDLVVAYDENMLKELLGLSAQAYYDKSLQLQRDYPDQLAIFHWEVVPGQYLVAENLSYPKSCPLGGVVFARYLAPGEHRVRLGKEHNIEIQLKESSFCITPLNKSSFF